MVPEDANVNPVDLCMAYARAAKNHGVSIREGTGVAAHPRRGMAAPPASNSPMAARWRRTRSCSAPAPGRRSWRTTPASPCRCRRSSTCTSSPSRCRGLPNPFPVVRDLDTRHLCEGRCRPPRHRRLRARCQGVGRLWPRGRPRLPRNAGGLGTVRPLHGGGPRPHPATRRDRHPALHERARELHRRHPPLYRRDAGGRRALRRRRHELGRHHELRRHRRRAGRLDRRRARNRATCGASTSPAPTRARPRQRT